MLLNFFNERRITNIPIVQIRPVRTGVRKNYSPEKIKELAQSIKISGIIQPLTVRRINQSEYELIAGERRLRAAVMCGCKKVPCVIISCTDKQADTYSLSESLQRCDLNFFEEAEGIENLMLSWKMTRQEAARRLGKKQSAVSGKLSVLKLTNEEKDIILKYHLSERHARALLRVEDPVMRRMILSEIISKGLNVSQSEKYISAMLSDCGRKKVKTQRKRLVLKDLRIFENTINKAVEMIKASGLQAHSENTETEEYIEYTVRVLKNKEDADSKSMTA